jgi:hypothetical protein
VWMTCGSRFEMRVPRLRRWFSVARASAARRL